MGAIFATLLFPFYDRLLEKKLSPSTSSTILTLGVTICFLVPMAILILLGAQAVMQKIPALRDFKDSGGFERLMEFPVFHSILSFGEEWFGLEFDDILMALQDAAESLAGSLGQILGGLASGIPSATISLMILMISLFFFLVDGRKVVAFIYDTKILSKRETKFMLDTTGSICRALIFAMVIVSFMQASIFALGCLFAGVGNVALFGFIVFLMSFVPLIGSAPLTFGFGFFQLAIGETSAGVILLVAALLNSTVDNFVRPMVLKGGANLHPLLAFVGVFGGLQTLGFAGMFLGPIVAGIFATSLKLLVHDTKS